MNSSSLVLRVFIVWLIADLACLAIGTRWNWLLGLGVRGLGIDLLLGVIILGQYLHDKGKL
jgi:hypothetical protein